jgi:hypothetical protein
MDDAADDRMTHVIAEPCIGTKDASCVEVFPHHDLHEQAVVGASRHNGWPITAEEARDGAQVDPGRRIVRAVTSEAAVGQQRRNVFVAERHASIERLEVRDLRRRGLRAHDAGRVSVHQCARRCGGRVTPV